VSEEPTDVRTRIGAIYRSESRRVLATLIRLLGDFDRAEEALHDAFAEALAAWPVEGIPEQPRAWLVSTGRFKAIDRLRRQARQGQAMADLAASLEPVAPPAGPDAPDVDDDQLRLIFTCCHPALAPEARVALTLREVCGLTTEEIARAFLASAPAIAQRIVRAKAKIRDAKIPYQVPARADLAPRLDAVLQVVYLVFNEGYAASAGSELVRTALCDEAIRLARLVGGLVPEPEASGLLALLLLTDARRQARTTAEGDIVTLDEQDRTLWDRAKIDEGRALVHAALASRRFGPYTLQAAIAAVHADAASADATDWREVVGLYDVLVRVAPSPVVELNRAAAIAMRDGPAVGLALIDTLVSTHAELDRYAPAHTARAELYRRLGRSDEARRAYQRAQDLCRQTPEERFLARRLALVDPA
jgi:RNA polymerase sigma-70 factor (ECF subfamily)